MQYPTTTLFAPHQKKCPALFLSLVFLAQHTSLYSYTLQPTTLQCKEGEKLKLLLITCHPKVQPQQSPTSHAPIRLPQLPKSTPRRSLPVLCTSNQPSPTTHNKYGALSASANLPRGRRNLSRNRSRRGSAARYVCTISRKAPRTMRYTRAYMCCGWGICARYWERG